MNITHNSLLEIPPVDNEILTGLGNRMILKNNRGKELFIVDLRGEASQINK
jgi:hypothetical protein